MIEHLFGSKTRLKLLQIFLANPNKSYYVRELSRMIDMQLNAVRREISNLESIGLIAISDHDNDVVVERCKYYRVKKTCMFFLELKELLSKVQIMEERDFVEQLKKRGGEINFLMLTGYFTGDSNVESDMLIVGDVKNLVLKKLIAKFEKQINKELRYTIMKEAEFFERREIGDKFLYTLFESKYIIGVDKYNLL